MGIRGIGFVVVYHVRDIFDMEPARRDIRGDKYPEHAFLEIAHHALPLALALAAMEVLSLDVVFIELVAYVFDAAFGCDEHDGP